MPELQRQLPKSELPPSPPKPEKEAPSEEGEVIYDVTNEVELEEEPIELAVDTAIGEIEDLTSELVAEGESMVEKINQDVGLPPGEAEEVQKKMGLWNKMKMVWTKVRGRGSEAAQEMKSLAALKEKSGLIKITEEIDGQPMSYDQIVGDKSKQAQFWEKHLGLKKGWENKERGIAMYTGGEELPGYSIVYDREGGYEHFLPDEKSAAYQSVEDVNKILKNTNKSNSPEELDVIMEKNKDIIFSQFKIHLQPKKEYIPMVIDRIIKVMTENPSLRPLIAGFKAKLGGSEKKSNGAVEQMAEVVIYPKPGGEVDKSGKTEGRRNLEVLLAAITDVMRDLEEASNNKVPRDNAKVTDLIYIAQSDGNLKAQLKEAGLIDKYMDKDANGNYVFAKSEQSMLVTTEKTKLAA